MLTDEGERLTADLVLLAAGVANEWFEGLGIGVEERPPAITRWYSMRAFPGCRARLRALYIPWSSGGAATALPDAISAAL